MRNKINKAYLVDILADKYVLTKKTTSRLVEDLFELIAEAVENGYDVNIDEFGKFTTKFREGRIGIHPATQERIIIPAITYPVFNPSKPLKKRVRNSGSTDLHKIKCSIKELS